MTTTTADTIEPATCGRLGDEHGSLPLVAVAIDGDVCGLVATTVVRQTFRNTRTAAIEATYVFPLPDRAGVTSFVADLAGRVVEGRLDERGRAREEYDQAIASGHRAAIAEEDRPGVFTMRVGNLQPGEEAVVTLTMTGPLSVDEGVAEYRFPLVVAPRYVAGVPLGGADVGGGYARDTDRVPDASRVTPPVLLPGQESPVRLSMRATLAVSGLTAAQVTSTLHDAVVDKGDDVVRVELRVGERLDRDVVLCWPVAADELRASAVIVPDADGEQATWQVTVLPPAPSGETRPRDVVVVLDRSGSMGGWKMVAARRAAARIVDTLSAGDRFAVLAFDNVVERPPGPDGMRAGTDRNRWAAVSWLAELDARGGTEMRKPLQEAVLLAGAEPAADRDRYVVLVTDGQVAGEDDVLRALGPAAGAARVFTLGIDRAVNAGFLRRLAALGGGRCDLVESEDRLDAVLAGLHRRICPPLATGLTVTMDGAEVLGDDTAPARAPDVFPGVPVTLAGRLAAVPAGDVALTVRGDGIEQVVPAGRTVASPPTPDSASIAVRTVWARARVRDLEDTYAANRGRDLDPLADRIVATSLAHGVLSRFTAFVAVDRDRTTGSTAPQPVIQPVELPSGWSRSAVTPMAHLGGGGSPVAPAGRQRRGMPAFDAPAYGAPMAAAEGAAPAMLSRMRGPGRSDTPGAPPQPLTTAAYVHRVERLLARLEGGERGQPLTTDLDELLDDLASVRLTPPWADALRALRRALDTGEPAVPPAVAELRRLLPDKDEAPPTPADPGATHPPRQRDFWRT